MKKPIFEIREPISDQKKLKLTVAAALVMLCIWSLLSYTGAISTLILPKPHAVLMAYKVLWTSRIGEEQLFSMSSEPQKKPDNIIDEKWQLEFRELQQKFQVLPAENVIVRSKTQNRWLIKFRDEKKYIIFTHKRNALEIISVRIQQSRDPKEGKWILFDQENKKEHTVGEEGVEIREYIFREEPESIRIVREKSLIEKLQQGLPGHIFWSFTRVGAGFLLAVVVALPLGILMGTYPVIKHAIQPYSNPLRYLPIAALIPLFVLWFGLTETQKILFLFVGIVVYLLPIIIEAVEDVDNVYLETAYTLKATRWQAIRSVLIPGASPLIGEGIRVMNGIGWTYVILAEVINAERGLGALIITAQKRSHTDWIFASIIIILIIGFVSDWLIARFNARKFSWKEAPGKL